MTPTRSHHYSFVRQLFLLKRRFLNLLQTYAFSSRDPLTLTWFPNVPNRCKSILDCQYSYNLLFSAVRGRSACRLVNLTTWYPFRSTTCIYCDSVKPTLTVSGFRRLIIIPVTFIRTQNVASQPSVKSLSCNLRKPSLSVV